MTRAGEKESVLIVDRAPEVREPLEGALASQGFHVFTASTVPEALRLLESLPVDLIVANHEPPHTNGLHLIRHVRENLRDTVAIMITLSPTVGGAVEAVKAGAENYLSLPIERDKFLEAARQALERLHVRRTARAHSAASSRGSYGLIGESEGMRAILRAILKAASTSATVLISGESGTGKELVARAIHYGSQRASAPFVAVNCGAIPETLLESELFGYVKGAFTGATESRAGFFQTADGGTIFLDEISETSPAMQVRLLRVLQDKEICMVGATRWRKVDTRVLAATNRDPESLVEKGTLREDLFYRLHVITINIPPLRERGNDILLLVDHFARRFAHELGKPGPQFTDQALRALRDYYWPGNVRELENVIQRLVLMSDSDVVEVADLPSLMRFSALHKSGFDRTLAEVEREYVRNVLASCGGNRTRAARILGIDRKTLREKLKASDAEAS